MVSIKKIENLEDLIKDSINGEVIEQNLTPLLAPGENYASVLYKVDFKVKQSNKIKDIHAVAKCVIPGLVNEMDIFQQLAFKLEISWYNIVIPTMIQFQKDQGITKTIDFIQKVYGSRISLDPTSNEVDLNAVILTKNLHYLGYKNVDRYIGFDLPTTHTILSKLATFHVIPLAIRHHRPELFNSKIRPYLQTWSTSEDMDIELTNTMFEVYQKIPEYQSLVDRLRERIKETKIFRKREIREPWATAVHIDFWSNNIMVTDESEYPNIVILDFQCPGFASPTADLAFFLLTSVDQAVIADNFDNLIKFYFDEFTRNLQELNVPLEKFNFAAFLNEFNTEVKINELLHALGHIAIIYSQNKTRDSDPVDFLSHKITVNDRHIKKFKWITNEAIKRHWI